MQTPSELIPDCVARAFEAALAEAWQFVGQTAPNPAVGCTLLDEAGEVLVVAAHHRAGQLHAERLALEEAKQVGVFARVHTAVVTLEPCNHTGRTRPCTEALLDSPVKTVWIGCPDPNPHVVGGGAAALTEAGVTVRWLADAPNAAVLAAKCSALIAPFAMRMVQGRPWITVKQALDQHGSMVPPAGQTTFTTPESLRFAHGLRRATDLVITGMGTVLADNPSFTVRHVPDHADRRRTLVVCGQEAHVPLRWREQTHARFDVTFCPDIQELPALLAETPALWAMVEAGPTLLAALRAQGLWDDWLTIRQDAHGADHFSVSTRHATTPLALFPEWARCAEE
ncbi:bifunctional diaminohydroxyphosphoribosylaminopyrimidine deaminase/5-amino-6-(5-phosphoribosylamino)uracil reductase RibD [Acetobacter orleanensis]|uniref:Riboflavin biosynthesis protein RibD n=1 Tax=Acetobacter orleanensis TaxID=104099 RepID=A0A4Y3TN57_9PROT|nr:bifunctional diaminohydroxyphosphoribosylaminopyrimidine deaminase/5-amino-6-(5-phosphoribosylamino)uracil reductase RibD [Acetobacter orleanensis]KXV66421.1 riboflavin biosynthesis protein RibD [Acetobacter orleanensis]PCD78789.1 riboflavin biosynthesis protein RibD [Acetobacter orleanensis]GAN67948.1 riboflavin biosynthesis protein RibD [diaminohydroxyphosphoribosylaminopyrimidine deaminase/5-amino-6-(5-phosphoribosylamino) uracil reductase] [Acetobacter orleanensis JCM 7639]GBR29526.1 rib